MRAAIVAPLVCVALLASGCGGRQRGAEGRARVALEVSAEVINDASDLSAGHYATKADKCYREATDRPGYDQCMAKADAAALAIIEAAQAVRVAEHILDATGDGAVMSCVLDSLVDVAVAVEAVGWSIPVDIGSAVDLVRPFIGAPCAEVQ